VNSKELILIRTPQRDCKKANELRDELIAEMRKDLGRGHKKPESIGYYLIDVPPLSESKDA
jgi:hypothetical protein